jgi:mono/diheme cytochrome c family protein
MKVYAALLAAAAFGLAVSDAHALSPAAQRGQTFAKTNCSMCHAVGKTGDSPLALAPPFRTLHDRYPVEDLEESLAEGIVTGHPTMPQFQLDAAQINDFIAYLKSLQE